MVLINQTKHQCKLWYHQPPHVHSSFYLYLVLTSSPSPTYSAPPLPPVQTYHQCWAYPDDHSLACGLHQPPLLMEHNTLRRQLSHHHCHQTTNFCRNCCHHHHCLWQHSPIFANLPVLVFVFIIATLLNSVVLPVPVFVVIIAGIIILSFSVITRMYDFLDSGINGEGIV
jgi:hypothetical protein